MSTASITAPATQLERPTMGDKWAKLPPVIILGGNDNALSLVRQFGRRGIDVYVVNGQDADITVSRYARPVSLDRGVPFERAAADWLCSSDSDFVRGGVLLAASDEAISILATHRDALAGRFLLDLCHPAAQMQMLDKWETLQASRDAGIPTPKFWKAQTQSDLSALQPELVYPIIVKPVLSHVFQRAFKKKFLVAENYEQLCTAFQVTEAAGIEVLLTEKIPGPDSALCSYYTWLDEDSQPLFDFTKRIIRRYPANMGLATYHVTDHVDGIKNLALQLFSHVGLQGVANIEFKYDARDGQLKIIECNARFTAANVLVTRAGIDIGGLVYNRLVGLPLPSLDHYQDGLTLWDPLRDFKAMRELRQRGELSTVGWLYSVLRRHTFPCFDLRDPRPALSRWIRRINRKLPRSLTSVRSKPARRAVRNPDGKTICSDCS